MWLERLNPATFGFIHLHIGYKNIFKLYSGKDPQTLSKHTVSFTLRSTEKFYGG